MRRSMLCVAVVGACLALAGCGGGNTYNPQFDGNQQPTFFLSVSPTSQSVVLGSAAAYTVTLKSANGFSQPVSLAVSGEPTGTTPTFTPPTVTPTASGATSTLTVPTTGGNGFRRAAGASSAGRPGAPTRSPSSYTLVISATGGGVTRTANATLTVTTPSGVAGIFFVDEEMSSLFHMDDMSGTNLTKFSDGPPGSGQVLDSPRGVALDATGRIYIVDANRVVRINDMSGAGWVTWSAGGGVTQLSSPNGVAIGPDGRIYIADTYNDRIVRIDDMTGANAVTYGTSGNENGQLNRPLGVFVGGDGRIYIADSGNNRVSRMDDMNGTNLVYIGNESSPFEKPARVVVGPDNRIYVADCENSKVLRFDDMSGANKVTFGSTGSGAGQFAAGSPGDPIGLWVATDGRIYACDHGNNRVVRFNDMSGAGWTTFTNSQMYYPYDIVVR